MEKIRQQIMQETIRKSKLTHRHTFRCTSLPDWRFKNLSFDQDGHFLTMSIAN